MATILTTLLESGLQPVTLEESDIGQKFTLVSIVRVYSGTFSGFTNGNKNVARVRDDITGDMDNYGLSSYHVFRGSPDDIKIDISLDSLNHLLGQGDNPLTSDNRNLVNLIAYTKPNGGKRRKTNKKRKTSKRMKMSRRN